VQSNGQGRLAGLDSVRAGGILTVVFIHAGGWLVPATTRPDAGALAAALTLARFCVPALVLASGVALYHRYGGRPAEGYLSRRYARVLLPWLAWVPVFALVSRWNGDYSPDLPGLASWVLFGAGHLYFLLLIAQLYLFLLVLPRGRAGLVAVTVPAVLVQIGLGWLHTFGQPPSGPLGWPLVQLSYLEAPYWLGYFALGCLAGAYLDRLRALARWWPLALAGAAVMGVVLIWSAGQVPSGSFRQGNGVYLWPLMLPFTLLVAAAVAGAGGALAAVSGAGATAIDRLSRHSLGIYILHVGALAFIGRWVAAWPSGLRLPAMFAGALVAGYALTLLLSRSRLGAVAAGEPAPRPREGRFELAT
jgi:surface polysaccharide O-acyltransferase-like enzyme